MSYDDPADHDERSDLDEEYRSQRMGYGDYARTHKRGSDGICKFFKILAGGLIILCFVKSMWFILLAITASILLLFGLLGP